MKSSIYSRNWWYCFRWTMHRENVQFSCIFSH